MPSFIRQTHVMAFCLALLLAVPTATPANAGWWNPFSWWDAPPSAQELIQQRPNLARQPVDVRGFIENTVDEFRRNGGGEVDVEQMLDDMDEAYSQMGSLSNPLLIYVKGPLNPKRTALKALAATCIGDFEPATKVAACIAAGVLAVVVLKETADEARKRTEDWAKKKRDEQPIVLYHYTSSSGRLGITRSMTIKASLPPDMGGRTTDTQHGAGQYFTDILPNTMTRAQVARRLYGLPFAAQQARVTDYIAINVRGLVISNPTQHIFVHNATQPLDITGRLISSGTN